MNISNHPRITVLMPVYNCELYIKEAIDSILNQTFSDFEFIIIDDASTDETLPIIRSYDDNRIKLIEKPLNTGYTNSLNYGLSIAKGEYIARMDGDDISFPERFEKQINFLDKNLDVVVCGSFFKIIETDKIYAVCENHEEIKLAMLQECPIGHPTVMMRKEIFQKYDLIYDVSKEPAEDYDLWTRLSVLGKLHNLQEVLLNYRMHNSQVSKKRNNEQKKAAVVIRVNLLNYLNFKKNRESQNILKKIIQRDVLFFEEMQQFPDLKNKLILANKISFFEEKGFEKYLSNITNNVFKDYFLNREKYSPKVYFQYLKIKREWKSKLIRFHEVKLFIKSMIYYNKIN